MNACVREGTRSRVLGLFVCFHFLTANLEGRLWLHWRRRSFHSTWAEASIPSPAGPADCLEAAWSKEASSPIGLRLAQESPGGRAPGCLALRVGQARSVLLGSGPLNLGFHEKCWREGVSDGSLTSSTAKQRSRELP